jgi:hypothetical protein
LEPISIALGLAKAVPSIIGLFKGKGAEKRASDVIDIAKEVTGIKDPQRAVDAISENPELALQLKSATMDYLIANREIDLKEQVEHNRHVAEMEGTARDLLSIPGIGHLLLVARGAQRLCWGFGSLYITLMSLAGSWTFTKSVLDAQGNLVHVADTQKMVLVLIIDCLVLTVLFGERAMRNVLPIVVEKLLPIFKRVLGK